MLTTVCVSPGARVELLLGLRNAPLFLARNDNDIPHRVLGRLPP